jgi:hypothetical protein
VNKLSVMRGAAVVVVTVLAAVGLLVGSGAANATTGAGAGAGAINSVPSATATCTAWNLSNDLVYVYSNADAGGFAWGFLWPGGGSGSSAQCAYTGSSTVWGAHHNLCGGGSLYVAVFYWVAGVGWVIGYVPDACVWVAY